MLCSRLCILLLVASLLLSNTRGKFVFALQARRNSALAWRNSTLAWCDLHARFLVLVLVSICISVFVSSRVAVIRRIITSQSFRNSGAWNLSDIEASIGSLTEVPGGNLESGCCEASKTSVEEDSVGATSSCKGVRQGPSERSCRLVTK